jgi:hypothetical protein
MTDPGAQSPLRLRKKHGAGARRDATHADGLRLVNLQSPRGAIIAGLLTIVVFCVLWIALTILLNRVLPWMTIVLGSVLGLVVRLAGRGVDWRFPFLAATFALSGSLLANIVVAANVSAEAHGVGTLQILRSVTLMTWPVFFDEVWNAADAFFAVVAASLAAFLANRRLTRSERFALRLWQEVRSND